MTMHRAEFNYLEPRWGDIEMDLDEDLSKEDKEQAILKEIKDIYGETAVDVEIETLERIE
jgi:hypothetical protein